MNHELPNELEKAALALLALVEGQGTFAISVSMDTARHWAGAIAALEAIGESCDVMEHDLKRWLAANVEYTRRRGEFRGT